MPPGLRPAEAVHAQGAETCQVLRLPGKEGLGSTYLMKVLWSIHLRAKKSKESFITFKSTLNYLKHVVSDNNNDNNNGKIITVVNINVKK